MLPNHPSILAHVAKQVTVCTASFQQVLPQQGNSVAVLGSLADVHQGRGPWMWTPFVGKPTMSVGSWPTQVICSTCLPLMRASRFQLVGYVPMIPRCRLQQISEGLDVEEGGPIRHVVQRKLLISRSHLALSPGRCSRNVLTNADLIMACITAVRKAMGLKSPEIQILASSLCSMPTSICPEDINGMQTLSLAKARFQQARPLAGPFHQPGAIPRSKLALVG